MQINPNMKRPENFRKIDDVLFKTLSDNNYKFSFNGNDILWAFSVPDDTTYCLAFVFHWKLNIYEIKRAVNGAGTIWTDTLHVGTFHKGNMKTMADFIDWVKSLINHYEKYYN